MRCGVGCRGRPGGGLGSASPGLWNFKQESHMMGSAYSLESGRQDWRQKDRIDRDDPT